MTSCCRMRYDRYGYDEYNKIAKAIKAAEIPKWIQKQGREWTQNDRSTASREGLGFEEQNVFLLKQASYFSGFLWWWCHELLMIAFSIMPSWLNQQHTSRNYCCGLTCIGDSSEVNYHVCHQLFVCLISRATYYIALAPCLEYMTDVWRRIYFGNLEIEQGWIKSLKEGRTYISKRSCNHSAYLHTKACGDWALLLLPVWPVNRVWSWIWREPLRMLDAYLQQVTLVEEKDDVDIGQ